MSALYITYKQNGIPKRGVVSSQQYEILEKNPSVSELVIYPSQVVMEESYATATGKPTNTKKILFG